MAKHHAAAVLFAVLAACDGEDERILASTDAPAVDASDGIDGPGPDAPTDGAGGAGVVCGVETVTCPVPAQACCDIAGSGDTCIASGGTCRGIPMQCDGPEDCGAAEECCFFDGSRAICLGEGTCGTTGSSSNEMCHVEADCDTGESCCGTAPGPQIDLYSICTTGPCPQ